MSAESGPPSATAATAAQQILPVNQAHTITPLPRVTIQFCTQCKWMLRAAYFAQELLSTFSVSLGEVALQPSTGGTFIVTIYYPPPTTSTTSTSTTTSTSALSSKVLWDRKIDGGFPETKELKRRVRDVIEPGRDLGHVDRDHRAATVTASTKEEEEKKDEGPQENKAKCEDCS